MPSSGQSTRFSGKFPVGPVNPNRCSGVAPLTFCLQAPGGLVGQRMHLGWAGCRGEGLSFGGGGQSSGQVPPAHVKGKLGSDIASQPQKHPEGCTQSGAQRDGGMGSWLGCSTGGSPDAPEEAGAEVTGGGAGRAPRGVMRPPRPMGQGRAVGRQGKAGPAAGALQEGWGDKGRREAP